MFRVIQEPVKESFCGSAKRSVPEIRARHRPFECACLTMKKGTIFMSEIPYKVYLSEDEMPKQWYNLRADMINKPAPLVNPGTGQPMTAAELGTVFCDELVA